MESTNIESTFFVNYYKSGNYFIGTYISRTIYYTYPKQQYYGIPKYILDAGPSRGRMSHLPYLGKQLEKLS